MSNKGKQWRAILLGYAPLVVWIALILFFSGSRGSVDETSGLFRPILEFFFPSLTPEETIFYYGYVRKFLHFTVYAILGFLAFRAISTNGNARSPWLNVWVALLISFAVALTDEYIQSLDPSRSGTLYDVAIDMAGAASILFVMYILQARQKRRAAVKTSQ